MSKLTTVIQVMEQMKKQENMKLQLNGDLRLDEEVLMTIDKEIDKNQRLDGHQRFKKSGYRGHEKNPHGDMRSGDFTSKLKDLGFTDEELETMKANREKMMKYRPNRKDKVIMGLKMLDRMEEIKEENGKKLTLKFTEEDLPAGKKEMKQMRKAHAQFTKRFRELAGEKGDNSIEKFVDSMDGRGRMSHLAEMRVLKEALASKGIDLEEVDMKTCQVSATINLDNKITNIAWEMVMADGDGKELLFRGEGVAA